MARSSSPSPPRRRPSGGGRQSSRQAATGRAASPAEVLQLVLIPPDREGGDGRLLATLGSARVLEPFEVKGRRWQEIIRFNERIRRFMDGVSGATELPSGRELVRFGSLLFETLFPGEVRRLYDVARTRQPSRRLGVVFTSMIHWVADKPWELIHDPARKAFLAVEDVHFVRNVLTPVPAEAIPVRQGPLRILVAVAQPLASVPLAWEDEVRLIRRSFEPLIEADLVRVEIVPAVTPMLLHQQVGAQPLDVLHFIGHGHFDPERRLGLLHFEDDAGATQLVEAARLREIVCGRGIRLVFLNACETGRGGRADFNRGVAPALMAGGMPAVVANQYSVLDPMATAFARHFYWHLARGWSLGAAAQEARTAVSYAVAGESLDWAIPVLYARDPSEALCRRAPATTAIGGVPRSRRPRRRRQDRVRVGLWDVNQVLPSLERIAEVMTQGQGRFDFEVADLSAPLGTWRPMRDQESGLVVGRLDARRLGESCRSRPDQLGVDHLICITDYWIGDHLQDNAYLWASEHGDIAVFSTAGFLRDLVEQQVPCRRAIMNCVAAALASIRADMSAHASPPKRCPFHVGPDTEAGAGAITGEMKFDARCRRLLSRRVPKDVEALEKLLSLAAGDRSTTDS